MFYLFRSPRFASRRIRDFRVFRQPAPDKKTTKKRKDTANIEQESEISNANRFLFLRIADSLYFACKIRACRHRCPIQNGKFDRLPLCRSCIGSDELSREGGGTQGKTKILFKSPQFNRSGIFLCRLCKQNVLFIMCK